MHFDPGADAWVTHKANSHGYIYAGAAIDQARRHLVVTINGETLYVYDLAQPDLPAQTVTTTGLGSKPGQAPGFEAVPSLDRVAMWSGGRSVHWLDPVTWAWTTTEGTGDDPGAGTTNGTFGRFRYSARLGVFIAVSAVNRNVFLFKVPPALP